MDQTIDSFKPNIKEITPLSKNLYRVVLDPFEPHYAQLVGTALRRIMLSSISGYAITAAEIEGVLHEYSAVEGIQEDILLVLLNLKEVAVSAEGYMHDDPVLEVNNTGINVDVSVFLFKEDDVFHPYCPELDLVGYDYDVNYDD